LSVNCLSKQLASPRSPPCGAQMDCHGEPPRVAFGHLDQDGCLEEDGFTVDVLVAVTPDVQLCSVTFAEREPVQHPKTQIWLADAEGAPVMAPPVKDA
jgi:hypothetical protein